MKYRVSLTDFRNKVYREYIEPHRPIGPNGIYMTEDDAEEDRLNWLNEFLPPKVIRDMYKMSKQDICNILYERFEVVGIYLSLELIEEIQSVANKVSSCNDAEIFAKTKLTDSELELELSRDHTWGSSKKGENFNIRMNIFDKNDKCHFGGHYRNFKGKYDDDKMIAGMRECMEDNYNKKVSWGDYYLDCSDGTIKYYGYDNVTLFHITTRRDINEFWSFIRVNLPSLKEKKRMDNLDNLLQ